MGARDPSYTSSVAPSCSRRLTGHVQYEIHTHHIFAIQREARVLELGCDLHLPSAKTLTGVGESELADESEPFERIVRASNHSVAIGPFVVPRSVDDRVG